jgi:hypothetical protein
LSREANGYDGEQSQKSDEPGYYEQLPQSVLPSRSRRIKKGYFRAPRPTSAPSSRDGSLRGRSPLPGAVGAP